MQPTSITLKIKRQDSPRSHPYWETFVLPYRDQANVISCLQEIQRNPVNHEGRKVRPVVWDCSCLEEVCGSCTMLINGRVRQSCTALMEHLAQPVVLEPLTKFPVVRDLQVDRTRMFEALKQVKAWLEVDGTHNIGAGPAVPPKARDTAYALSQCMTCGCCLEACPQYTKTNDFLGAFAFSQVRYFNLHPTGAMQAGERLDSVMGSGGITNCGNAQVCVEMCPKHIPLTESIADVGRQTSLQLFKNLLGL